MFSLSTEHAGHAVIVLPNCFDGLVSLETPSSFSNSASKHNWVMIIRCFCTLRFGQRAQRSKAEEEW